VRGEPVGSPLPDVAGHVEEAVAVRGKAAGSNPRTPRALPRHSPATVEVRVTTNCGSSALAGPRRRS
jgi:hypothetical protein